MSVHRIFSWRCDGISYPDGRAYHCNSNPVHQSAYGVPDGWHWYHRGLAGVHHACPACSDKLKVLNNVELNR